MKAQTEKLINAYFAIVKSDDYAQFGDLITDDCKFSLMPIGHTFTGRKDVMEFVLASGGVRKHDKQSPIKIKNWFTDDEYFCVEYDHYAIVKAFHSRIHIDGYCMVFHMRDGKFDEIREYINPSGKTMSFMTTYVLRILPFAAKMKARRKKHEAK